LVELHLVDLLIGFNANFESDALTEGVSVRSTEAHVDQVFLFAGHELVVDLQRNGKFDGLVSSNRVGDRNVRNLNGHGFGVTFTRIVHTEEATLFPGPLSAIQGFKFSKGGLAGLDDKDFIMLALENGAFGFPGTLSVTSLEEVFNGAFWEIESSVLGKLGHILGFETLGLHELLHAVSPAAFRPILAVLAPVVAFALLHLFTHVFEELHLRLDDIDGHVDATLLGKVSDLLRGDILFFHELGYNFEPSTRAEAVAARSAVFLLFAFGVFLKSLHFFLDDLKRHVDSSVLSHLLDVLRSCVLLLHELVENFHPGLGAKMLTVSPRTVTVMSAATTSSEAAAMATSVSVTSLSLLRLLWFFSWKDCDHNCRNFTWVTDLKEGVRVLHALLACTAEIKVLAYAAFVTDSFDGVFVTAVTSSHVLNFVVSSDILEFIWLISVN